MAAVEFVRHAFFKPIGRIDRGEEAEEVEGEEIEEGKTRGPGAQEKGDEEGVQEDHEEKG
jgi:hypothetical protein